MLLDSMHIQPMLFPTPSVDALPSSHWRIVGLVFLVWMTAYGSLSAQNATPKTVEQLFADFDPRREPLETLIVREWEKDEIIYRYVTFHVGVFKQQPARIAGFYAFPKHAKNLPGLLHLHGGGQRAFLHEVGFYAKRGYACLSINWGGREMEESQANDPNTQWGAVDPTQNNVPGYFNLLPGERYLDPMESPRNNNWYLLTLCGRRGLTFLEQQPEVDSTKLGVYGHSMGGNLTIYIAGTDERVRVAAPSVGGSGFRHQPWPLLPEQKKQLPNGDVALFDATLGFESYASRISCPVLWLGSTNDFHGIMDDTFRTGNLITNTEVRYVFTPHMNHRFMPEYAVSRALWIDQHLKGTFELPSTPRTTVRFDGADRIPRIEVVPDSNQPVERVQVFYSLDPHPIARFWRTATSVREGQTWTSQLPIMSTDQPLFVFANVHYPSPRTIAEPYSVPTESVVISSLLHVITPSQLRELEVNASDQVTNMIDDFSQGWQDWYLLSADNPHHWEYSTRKINDPKWRGDTDRQLRIDVTTERTNQLIIVLTENFFRSYRGPMQEFVAVVQLDGTGNQSVKLKPSDFRIPSDKPQSEWTQLKSWDHIDLLSLRAYHEKDGRLLGSKNWQGPQPSFQGLSWE